MTADRLTQDPQKQTAPADTLAEQAERELTQRNCAAALTGFDEAEQAGADPDRCAAGRWMCHMFLGDYTHAWMESDNIRERGRPDPHRLWEGGAIDGKRLLIRCLHGFGDTVQYLRWLPQLRRRCSDVLVQAAPEMQALLQHFAAGGQVLPWTQPHESDRHLWDVQIEVAELPYFFRPTASTLPPPAQVVLSESRLHLLRQEMQASTRPRVGLVWTGSNFDSTRSLRFDDLQMLLANHSVEFWSLQAPGNNGDWDSWTRRHGWGSRKVTASGMEDMAALASMMDLVITVDTLAAHLCGSLQVPVWTLLKQQADWRWMLDREDSPWYPTMRLFRQQREGDWQPVLQRVCERLRDWCEEIAA